MCLNSSLQSCWRACLLPILAFASLQSLNGQTALTTREVRAAKTCLGNAEARSAPIDADPNTVIAVVAGTLSQEDLAQLQKAVLGLYQASKNKATLRLAVISGNTVDLSGPFKTRAQLLAGFTDIARPAPETAEAQDPIQLYSSLALTAQQLGGDWSTVVVAGRFPVLDKELTPYASSWLAARFAAARLRLNYWTPGEESEILEGALPAIDGSHLTETLASLPTPSAVWETSWVGPTTPAAFRVCPVSLLDADGETAATVPSFAAEPGFTVPDLDHFATLRAKIRSLSAVAAEPQLSATQMAQAEADLSAALEISPREEETLRLGAEIFRRAKNDARLATTLTALTGVAPAEPSLFAELGHTLFRMRNWDEADRALLKARELKPGVPEVAEELARIRLTRGDDKGFMEFVDERLSKGPGTQELWLIRADAATRLGAWEQIAESTERAIALGSVPLERRTTLVRLYMQHGVPDKALIHVRAVAGSLPIDAAVRTDYAGFLDELKQPQEALAAWKRTLEADPRLELAHYRIARLLIDQNSPGEALEAIEAGIGAAPRSARLYLAKAEVLEKQDRFYQARQTLRDAAASLSDSSLIGRLAEMEDAGGEHAARYYRALAEAGDKNALPLGLQAAQRDGDYDDIAWFQTQLGTARTAADRSRQGTLIVPGGMEALAFVAHSQASSPDRFLVEYARAVISNYSLAEKKITPAFTERVRTHFQRIAELAALGSPADGKVVVTLNAGDKNGQKNAEKVLDLLGWKMHTAKQGVKLDPVEKGAKASHQETATALALDEIGMQQALEAGKPFSFAIPMDSVSVTLGEEPWRTQFYGKEHFLGGFAEAMAGNVDLAQTYAALGEMDPGSATVLVAGVGLKTLEEKYSTLLSEYASSLAVEHDRVQVPGGASAAPIWEKLVGAKPSTPGPFLKALLSKDEGKLLAYYSALGELDMRHQRLFTRNAARTSKFYNLFKDSPEIQRSSSKHFKSGSFVEFLSEVPLDDEGNVDFPGSPEVWMVAKGQSHSTAHTDKLLKVLRRTVAPDMEDEILLHLADTHYKASSAARSELDNFVAVVRIDEHRRVPLDENSALLLAQHYAEDGAAYPYFTILTGLGQKQFEQFFVLARTIRQLSPVERAAQLAPIDSLIEILCLAQQAGTIDEARAAELFGKIVERFQKVTGPAQRTVVSLGLVREILSAGKTPVPDADLSMQNLLLGAAGPIGFPDDGTVPAPSRLGQYRRVLDLQKAPPLAVLLSLSDAANNLASGKGATAAQIQILESSGARIPVVEVSKDLGLKGKEKDLVEAFQPHRLQEIIKQFREKTAKKNVKLQDLEKLSNEYLDAIDTPTRWALAGIVYAYFLRPDDLLVSEDSLLLRKHRFAPLEHEQGSDLVFEPSRLIQSSERAGSNFQGGFAIFADLAGLAAAVSAKLGGENGQLTAGKQLSTIRSTNWDQLRDQDLRLFGLKVAVGREWIVRAAGNPELADSLGESSFGLLSLTRRAELLDAVAKGNWRSVWTAVTLSDQYLLADRYLDQYSKDAWVSPATLALRKELARNDGSRVTLLGTDYAVIFGCSHPHLREVMPYEEYEKDVFPFKLAERSSEFKLYLASYANTAGLSASTLGAVAEPAARAILKRVQLSDVHDWRSVLAGYAGFDGKAWQEALTAQ